MRRLSWDLAPFPVGCAGEGAGAGAPPSVPHKPRDSPVSADTTGGQTRLSRGLGHAPTFAHVCFSDAAVTPVLLRLQRASGDSVGAILGKIKTSQMSQRGDILLRLKGTCGVSCAFVPCKRKDVFISELLTRVRLIRARVSFFRESCAGPTAVISLFLEEFLADR